MRTIFYDAPDQIQIGWLIFDANGKCKYKSIKKDKTMHDSICVVRRGRFGKAFLKDKIDYSLFQPKQKTPEVKKSEEEIKEKKRNEVYPVFRYKNYSRKSGVYAYAISPDKKVIYVYFLGKKRGWYKYDVYSAPEFIIKNMVKRALSGWGLNRYINKHPQTYYWKGTY